MDPSKALNPKLLKRLKDIFDRVGVTNEGLSASVAYRPDYTYREGRLKAEVADWGETYHVNCPFCFDTRGRLYISHLWGVRDRKTQDDMLHLCHCHNESCLTTRSKHKELHAMLFPLGRWADEVQVTVNPEKTPPVHSLTVVRMPESVCVDQLPPQHPARHYLEQRGFSLGYLVKYGVRYCDEDTTSQPRIREPRMVIPLYMPPAITSVSNNISVSASEPRLVGWQARLIRREIIKGDIKYLTSTGTRKNQLLYGLIHAVKTTGPVVIVEGIFDAWKVGPRAVALLGKTISPDQCSLLVRTFHGRPLIVMLDSDAGDFAEVIQTDVIRARSAIGGRSPVLIAPVPGKHHDPGECSTAQLKKEIDKMINSATVENQRRRRR